MCDTIKPKPSPQDKCIPDNLIIITGYVGKVTNKFKVKRSPFPGDKRCIFFANDKNARSHAIRNGWRFVHLVNIPLGNNLIINSVLSKKLKFMKLVEITNAIAHHKCTEYILWVDHKRCLPAKHVFIMIKLLKSAEPHTGILLRATPANKTSIWQEFREANMQNRYRKFAHITKQVIKAEIAKPGISPNGKVANTGLILYDLKNENTQKLADSVYSKVTQTGNPMCQIFWMLESQKFPGLVKMVPFGTLRC